MNKRNILTFSLLILGLLFSAIIRFKFNLSQGFEFKGFGISLPTQFLDFAGVSSNELSLNSQLIGYVFYLIFGMLYLKRVDFSVKPSPIIIVFLGLVGVVILSDLYSFYQDLNNQFTGRHFRIGLTVFLIGLVIFNKFKANKTKV